MATATMTPAKVERPLENVKPAKKRDIVADLNAALASHIDLAIAAKQAHWNVRGPNFHGLHELFDQVAEAARAYADDLAERAVALGGIAQGTVEDVSRASALAKMPNSEQRWEPLVKAVHARLVAASAQARESSEGLDDDMATQDVYVEVMRGLDKWAWMLEAHLG